jgi:Ser/Thr protein kinase RdoA (MazF antagonist)
MRVPSVVPTREGLSHAAGVMVLTWLDGTPPGSSDWPAVYGAFQRLHELTADWPQRPGFRSTSELMTADKGGDVDLTAMPAEAVAECRRAWAALAGTPMAVVHGDPGPTNIRVSPAGVGLLDWDEARRDYTDLDLAQLPARCCHLHAWPPPAPPRPHGRPRTGGWWSRPMRAPSWPGCAGRASGRPPRRRLPQ